MDSIILVLTEAAMILLFYRNYQRDIDQHDFGKTLMRVLSETNNFIKEYVKYKINKYKEVKYYSTLYCMNI